jgi:hypothetical protein
VNIGRSVPWSAFAPTGPMQEVALSSGWGEELGALARRFDAFETAAGD